MLLILVVPVIAALVYVQRCEHAGPAGPDWPRRVRHARRHGGRALPDLMQSAGGLWEPGSWRWLIERRRIGPVIRALRHETDPLLRRAGMSLDDG